MMFIITRERIYEYLQFTEVWNLLTFINVQININRSLNSDNDTVIFVSPAVASAAP